MGEEYKVSSYSNEELFHILELDSPTDSELEARIIQLLQRHQNLKNPSGKKLFNFFNDIYKHFFQIDDDLEEEISLKENFSTMENSTMENSTMENSTMENSTMENNNVVSEVYTTEHVTGYVNPILKETINRTIAIDSQFRDEEYPFASDFTINFSETLKDVVSLRLYSVQIPVTWYTISERYGSNYFFLKPILNYSKESNTLGIYNEYHEYKIEIEPGNYSSESVVSAVNTSLQGLSTKHKDVNFGDSKIEYDFTQVKSSISINLQKLYNEFDYEIYLKNEEIKKLLGFNDNIFVSEELKESLGFDDNVFLTNAISVDPLDESWKIENGLLEIVEYEPTVEQDTYYLGTNVEDESNYLNPIQKISINLPTNVTKTLSEWINVIQELFDNTPSISGSTIIWTGTSILWNIKPNREIVTPNPSTRWALRCPNEQVYIDNLLPTIVNELSIRTYNGETDGNIIEISSSEYLVFRPVYNKKGGVYINPNLYPEYSNLNDIEIEIPEGEYNKQNLIEILNTGFANNSITYGTTITEITNTEIEIKYEINKYFTTRDYKIVFYDITSFAKCSNRSKSFRNATVDTTLGYILGFKTLEEYNLNNENITNYENKTYYVNPDTELTTDNIYNYEESKVNGQIINTKVMIRGDSVVSIYLYNYFMILLDDFNQNHMNDGLVTLTQRDNSVTLPRYANRKLSKNCNPDINDNNSVMLPNTSGLTQKQIYSVEQILESQNKEKSNYNDGLFIHDMFALLPMKTSGMTPGTTYVEFGGTLQQQERTYFGPVNIRRLSIKLVNDKGDIIDLNGANWSMQLICEQIYQSNIKK